MLQITRFMSCEGHRKQELDMDFRSPVFKSCLCQILYVTSDQVFVVSRFSSMLNFPSLT